MDVNRACRPINVFFGIEFVVLKDDASVLDCVLSRSYSDIIEVSPIILYIKNFRISGHKNIQFILTLSFFKSLFVG